MQNIPCDIFIIICYFFPLMDGYSIINMYVSKDCDNTTFSDFMKDRNKPGAAVGPRPI